MNKYDIDSRIEYLMRLIEDQHRRLAFGPRWKMERHESPVNYQARVLAWSEMVQGMLILANQQLKLLRDSRNLRYN